jgi:hypothetical protein
VALPPWFVDESNRIAQEESLVRPVGWEVARWCDPDEEVRRLESRLTVVSRPKWRRKGGGEVTKKEVEANEKGLFAKWVQGVEDVMTELIDVPVASSSSPSSPPPPHPNLRPRPFYESNLEVYRQLWRVTERSDIILVLADVRCPAVHLAESLRTYLRALVYGRSTTRNGRPNVSGGAGGKKVVVVLTKTDLVEERCRDKWVVWCRRWWRYGHASRLTDGNGEDGSQQERHAEERDADHGHDDGHDEDDIDVVCVESYKRPIPQGKHHPRAFPPSWALQTDPVGKLITKTLQRRVIVTPGTTAPPSPLATEQHNPTVQNTRHISLPHLSPRCFPRSSERTRG